jgi:hypothetical protein
MTTAEQLDVVNRKLRSKASATGSTAASEAVVFAEGGLVQGWMKARDEDGICKF